MLAKKANLSTFLIFEFKMGHKAVETIHNINNAFGPGTANKRFASDESLEDEKHSGQAMGS